jgi:hypothetical protein
MALKTRKIALQTTAAAKRVYYDRDPRGKGRAVEAQDLTPD